jgi:hypothetical protein
MFREFREAIADFFERFPQELGEGFAPDVRFSWCAFPQTVERHRVVPQTRRRVW